MQSGFIKGKNHKTSSCLIIYKNTKVTSSRFKSKRFLTLKLCFLSEHGDTILRLESGIKTNAEKINSNFGIFEEEVKRLDEKNKQFSTGNNNDVL